MTHPSYEFETPEPIALDLAVDCGRVRIVASERGKTIVEVRPARKSRRADIEAADRTRVDFSAGRLEVRAPSSGRLGLLGRPGQVEVLIQLPAGSSVRGTGSYGDLETEGRLGECSYRTSYGTLRMGDAEAATLHTSAGDITVGRIPGVADLSSSAGNIRLGETGSSATLKTSAGDIHVERSAGVTTARTAYGGLRVMRAVSGELDLTTSYGDVEVGVADGIATLLEARSKYGSVRNQLDRAEVPGRGAYLKVRALTGFGEIRIRRA